MSALAELETRSLAELRACPDEAALRAWHTRYFGKEGEVPVALKKVSTVPPAERKAYGQQANQLKEKLTQTYEAALAYERDRALERSLATDKLDVTLSGRLLP